MTPVREHGRPQSMLLDHMHAAIKLPHHQRMQSIIFETLKKNTRDARSMLMSTTENDRSTAVEVDF
jgi:hypothetical protein